MIPLWCGSLKSILPEKATCWLMPASAVTIFICPFLFFHRSMTTQWSQPAWMTIHGRWFPAWTTCWPKLWRSTESCPGTNIADWWCFDHSGPETETLTKVEDFKRLTRAAKPLCRSKPFKITFYSPSGRLHSFLWRERLQKLRWCEDEQPEVRL